MTFCLKMSDHAIRRRNWRRNWLDAIAYFEDVETQRRRWLDPTETNPHWSFVEIMCGYFDDCSLDLGYRYWIDKGHLTAEEAEAVSEFHSLADSYKAPNGDYDRKSVLEDPNWHTVCEAARESASRLRVLLTDANEKALIETQNRTEQGAADQLPARRDLKSE